jgi:hypothetical protein
MGDNVVSGGEAFDWEAAEDITALCEEELRARLEELTQEERAVSYRRGILQGRIEVIRAQLVRRGAVALCPEELVRALLDEGGRS